MFDYFVEITKGKCHLTRMQAVLKAYVEAVGGLSLKMVRTTIFSVKRAGPLHGPGAVMKQTGIVGA